MAFQRRQKLLWVGVGVGLGGSGSNFAVRVPLCAAARSHHALEGPILDDYMSALR